MLFLNRVYFYSNYIQKVLISSVLVFLFSYSFYSVGVSQSADNSYKAIFANKKVTAKAVFDKAYVKFIEARTTYNNKYKTIYQKQTFGKENKSMKEARAKRETISELKTYRAAAVDYFRAEKSLTLANAK